MKYLVLLFSIFTFSDMKSQDDFLELQMKHPKVQSANSEKYNIIKNKFESKGLTFPMKDIFWRAFKHYKTLELWAYCADSQSYILVETYKICETVGDFGPKRQEGDFQIPEGFYYLDIFNPDSKYFLSMHVNYPNESDRILGVQGKLGGDIYVHGGCETVGCLPMTDEVMKEIYIVNVHSRASGLLRIPIHIFPMRLTVNNLNKLKQDFFKGNTKMINFWNNLKIGYDYFETKKNLPNITVDPVSGKYLLEH